MEKSKNTISGWLLKHGDPEITKFVEKSSVPHCCPVCNGNGLVPNGFYAQWSTSSVTPEQCRSCSGSGVIWSQ